MQIPVEIKFHNMDQSKALVSEIERRANKLKRGFNQIRLARIDIEAPHRPHRRGDRYQIRIQVTAPNREFTAGDGNDEHQNEDPFIAVHNAFDAIHRQLAEHHEEFYDDPTFQMETLKGHIVRICLPDGPEFPERGIGFIATEDGREIYFNAASLLGIDFGRIEVGNEVRYIEEQTEEGLQASFVQVIAR